MPEPKTILVVEEELKVGLLIKRSLEEVGYQVLLAEAVEVAKQTLQETRVDAVIVSWELPELSGQELALWIRQQPPRMGRQLIMIAVGNVPPVITSVSPVDVFVPCPCNPDEILAFLKRLLRFEERSGIGNA
jgi:DNA-binding response OmpR family regulator